MKHYLDITLLPSEDDGISLNFLWTKVMTQLHLALVEIKDDKGRVPIAVSFPNYRCAAETNTKSVGRQLRLLAEHSADFSRLNIGEWLARLDDYVHLKSIKAIDPDRIQGFEAFGRKRKPMNVDYMIRRRMKGKGTNYEEAAEHFKDFAHDKRFLTLPYIKMKSLESGHDFTLAIVRKERTAAPEAPVLFNTYGLNLNAALPKF